jgi:hypothetical protein
LNSQTPQLATFTCKYCARTFTDGRALGGHVRQVHPSKQAQDSPARPLPSGEGEVAARVLELWKSGSDPFTVISTLRVHPSVVKEVLKEYDELLNEWKKFKEA